MAKGRPKKIDNNSVASENITDETIETSLQEEKPEDEVENTLPNNEDDSILPEEKPEDKISTIVEDEDFDIVKKYQCTNAFKMSLELYEDGNLVAIPTFDNGILINSIRNNGKFITSDKRVQRLLEEHPYFNKEYILLKETKVMKPIKEKEIKTSSVIEVAGISNIQEARDYLLGVNKKLSNDSLKNKESILAIARELNIIFKDLK